jgi:hypothetical protein
LDQPLKNSPYEINYFFRPLIVSDNGPFNNSTGHQKEA